MSRLLSIRLVSLCLMACSLIGMPSRCSADDQVHAFFVGKLWTGHDEPIVDAVMLVSNGQITAVGTRSKIDVPAAAIPHQLRDAVVVPGFVIAETSLGVGDDDERTLTPEVRAIDGFDLFADYSRYVAAGVTTVQISPGQQRLMPGQGAVVKLAGEDLSRRVLSRQESLRIVLSSESANAPRIYEPPVGAVSVDNPLDPTRPQVSQSLSARIAGLRAIFAAARSGENDAAGVLNFDALRESMAPGRIRIKARTAAEIRAAISLFSELQESVDKKMQLLLVDPVELESFLTGLQDLKSIGIVLNAGVRPGQVSNPSIPDDDELPNREIWEYAAALVEGGLTDSLAVRPAADADLDDVLFLAGLFTRGGTSQLNVLKMLTSNPAKILGVEKTVGSLTPGHDADFVVLSGDPFQSGTMVQATWINGERVYSRESTQQAKLIQADMVFASNGQTVADGGVLVSGTKIQAVGKNVSVPDDVLIHRFPGAVIVPGFVDLGTGLGFGGTISNVSLATKLGDRLASDDRAIGYARKGGVTTAVFATSGSPSPMLAFKLGDTPRLLKEPVGIRFSMPSNLTSGLPSLQRTLAAGKAYADAWKKYETELADYQKKLKEYELELAKYEAEKKAAADKKAAEEKAAADKKAADAKSAGSTTGTEPPKTGGEETKPAPSEKPADPLKTSDSKTGEVANQPVAAEKSGDTPAAASADAKPDPKAPVKPTEPKKPPESAAMEPYRSLMAGSIPAVVEANDINAINAAVKLFREEFKLTTILVGAEDAYRMADVLAANNVSVSVGPTLVRRVENSIVNLPQVLANHQISFAFQSNATTGVRQLPLAIQYSVFRGLGAADALNGLTESAAKMLSLQSSIGSLEAGKDADLVVLSGPPFEPSSEVLAVMIDGEWVYERGAKP